MFWDPPLGWGSVRFLRLTCGPGGRRSPETGMSAQRWFGAPGFEATGIEESSWEVEQVQTQTEQRGCAWVTGTERVTRGPRGGAARNTICGWAPGNSGEEQAHLAVCETELRHGKLG